MPTSLGPSQNALRPGKYRRNDHCRRLAAAAALVSAYVSVPTFSFVFFRLGVFPPSAVPVPPGLAAAVAVAARRRH